MIIFLKGLLMLFLVAPFSLYIIFGFGYGDVDDLLRSIKSYNSFLLNTYLIYYPIAALAIFLVGLVIVSIYTLGKII